MPTFRERVARVLDPTPVELRRKIEDLEAIADHLVAAYQEGIYELPPDELIRQLKEWYDPQLVADLLDQLNYEVLSGYGGYDEGERQRAVQDGKRLFKFSILARWIVNLWTFYGLGENVDIIPSDETKDPEDEGSAQQVWDEFWSADRNQRVLAKDRLDELSRWLLNTGERFFVFFGSPLDGELTIRTLDPDEIVGVISNPKDRDEYWFYKRVWTDSDKTPHTLYYPDWQILFTNRVEKCWAEAQDAYSIRDGELAEEEYTDACVLFITLLELDEKSPRGWPLLTPHGTPWLKAHRDFMRNRATVTSAVAAVVRRYRVEGGSRAVDSVRRTLASMLQLGGTVETNPPTVAGSAEILNRAVDAQETPLKTGAMDAKADSEMFSWFALLAGGLFPHYAGMGDAYRLATATAMEKPLELQFSQYRNLLGAMFRKIVRVVLQYHERTNGGTKFETYEAEVSTDRLVEIDLTVVAEAVAKIYESVIKPALEAKSLPYDAKNRITTFLLQITLQALGADDPTEYIDEDMFLPEDELPEEPVPPPPPPPGQQPQPGQEQQGQPQPGAEGEEVAPAEAVDEVTGRVIPTGSPLEPWVSDTVGFTVDEVAQAIRDWDLRLPPAARGVLMVRPLTDEEATAREGGQ